MKHQYQPRDRRNRSTAVGIIALAAALTGGATLADEPPESRTPADRSAESRTTSELAIRGLPSREVRTSYRDGEPTGTYSTLNSYDARWNLIESVRLRDSFLDDLPEMVVKTDTWVFDERDNFVEMATLYPGNSQSEGLLRVCVVDYVRDRFLSWQCDKDRGNDGSIDVVEGGRFRYDRGNVVETTRWFEDTETGWIFESTDRATFDSRGNRVESVAEFDHGADGVIDSLTTERWTFDDSPHANETEFESVRDSDADGVPDRIERRLSNYNRSGRLVRQVFEEDEDGDGIPDELIATGHSYDGDGHLATTTVDKDYDADGVLDSTVVTEFRYDARGNIVEESEGRDYEPDGLIDVTERVTRRFDRRGNLLEEIVLSGIRPAGNGLPSYTQVYSYAYDEIGNLIEETHSAYRQEATVPSWGSTVTYTY